VARLQVFLVDIACYRGNIYHEPSDPSRGIRQQPPRSPKPQLTFTDAPLNVGAETPLSRRPNAVSSWPQTPPGDPPRPLDS